VLSQRHAYEDVFETVSFNRMTCQWTAVVAAVRWWWPQCGGGGDQPPLYVTLHLFAFTNNQSRLVCQADGGVKYQTNGPETIWTVPIPMDKAATIDPEQRKASSSLLQEVAATSTKTPPQSEEAADANGGRSHPDPKCLKTEKRQKGQRHARTIHFICHLLRRSHDIRWSHLQSAKHDATSQVGFATFPRYYFIVHMQRYQLGPDWRKPIQLKVCLLDIIPEHLDF